MANSEYVHGPVTERRSDCLECDIDRHSCPGCGEWLHHGTDVCGPCADEHGINRSSTTPRPVVVDVLNIDVPDHRPGEPVPSSEHDPEGIVVGGVFYSGEEGL